MKKTKLVLLAGIGLFQSWYSFEACLGCPAYVGQDEFAKHGLSAQIRYADITLQA